MTTERFEWIVDRDGLLPEWLKKKTREGWVLQEGIMAVPTARGGLEYVFTRMEDGN